MITPPLLDPMRAKAIVTTDCCIYIAHQTVVLALVCLTRAHRTLSNELGQYAGVSKVDIDFFKDEAAGPGGLWKIDFSAPKINILATSLSLSVPHSSSKWPYSDPFLEC